MRAFCIYFVSHCLITMTRSSHELTTKNNGYQQFEWYIPHVFDNPNVVVTFSRNQITSQRDRLGLFPILSQARTSVEFAVVIKKLLFVRSKNALSQQIHKSLVTFLFGHRGLNVSQTTGIISTSHKQLFLRRLGGLFIKQKACFIHGRFTRKHLEELAEVKDMNQTIFKTALQNFDKNKIIISTTANGKRTNRSTKSCGETEVVYVDYRKSLSTLRLDPSVSPTDMRMIFEQLFSFVGRGAGSRLAGSPLTLLDESTNGIKTKSLRDFPKNLQGTYGSGGNHMVENHFTLSPRKIVIGEPYADRLQKSSILVTRAINVVSQKLDYYIRVQGLSGRKIVPVEEIVEYSLLHIKDWVEDNSLMDFHGVPARTHQQMDYFFTPRASVKRRLIQDMKNRGQFSDQTKKILRTETQLGNLRLGIIDVSGGAGGTGLSERIASLAGFRTSGHIDAYIQSLLDGFYARKGRVPNNIILCPRKADLTLAAFEYIPVMERIRKGGIRSEIVLSEQLEEALNHHDGNNPFLVKTWDGKMIVPELIAKRYTFLHSGQEKIGERGHVYTSLPGEVVILPSPVSRIPASDKRVNGSILEVLKTKLAHLGVDVIPTLELSIVEENVSELVIKKINTFAHLNCIEYPEIYFLGLILKIDDKRPGREGKGDELLSVYPIPAGILKDNHNVLNKQETDKYIHDMVAHRIQILREKGVTHIIVQPNLLSIFADGKDFMETKVLVYSMLK